MYGGDACQECIKGTVKEAFGYLRRINISYI